jgi:hypothetical protein
MNTQTAVDGGDLRAGSMVIQPVALPVGPANSDRHEVEASFAARCDFF